MERAGYLTAIEREGRALLAAVDRAPDARVEHCPDWDNTGLADHMRSVWGFMATQVAAASPDRPTRPDPDDTSTTVEALDALLELLADADPEAPAWNWCPAEGRDVGWIGRRVAHETAIHRWDAENAVGDADPIDADLAADGIAEALDVAWRYQMRGPTTGYPERSLHLHRTDGDGEWLLTAVDDVLNVVHEHSRGDAAVRGTASDLALFMWNRRLPSLESFGDGAVVDAWVAMAP